MNLICAGDTGIIKVINAKTEEVYHQISRNSKDVQEQKKEHSVDYLDFCDEMISSEMTCVYRDGVVQSFYPATGRLNFTLYRNPELFADGENVDSFANYYGKSTWKMRNQSKRSVRIKGMYSTYLKGNSNSRNIVLCQERGLVEIHHIGQSKVEAVESDEEEEQDETLKKKKKAIDTKNVNVVEAETTSFNIKAPIEDFSICKVSGGVLHMATGGENNLLKIYDLEKQLPIYETENLPKDWLKMSVPVWIKGVSYVHNSDHLVAACSMYQNIFIYDKRNQSKKPIRSFRHEEQPFHCIDTSKTMKHSLYVADSVGAVWKYDWREKNPRDRVISKLRGSIGAVRAITCHPTNSLVATAGADRFIRVYNENSREMIHQMYVLQRQNVVRFLDHDLKIKKKAIRNREEEEEETRNEEGKDENEMEVLENGDGIEKDQIVPLGMDEEDEYADGFPVGYDTDDIIRMRSKRIDYNKWFFLNTIEKRTFNHYAIQKKRRFLRQVIKGKLQ